MRTLAAWDQIDDAGRQFWINHLDAADHLELAVFDRLLRSFPVNGNHIVAVFLRRGNFELPGRAFRVVAGPEGPTLARAFPGRAKIEVKRRHQNLPARSHLSRLRI